MRRRHLVAPACVLWLLVSACARESSTKPLEPEKKAAAPLSATPTASASTRSETTAKESTSPPDAAHHAAQPSAADAASLEEHEGIGSCKGDDDCLLSAYQPGCCVQACGPTARNKKTLLAAMKKEDCEHNRPKLCPPPAPCPKPTYRAVAAVCRHGHCTTQVQRL